MARVRRKTVEPSAREYFKCAREQGIELSYNNYEKMLPQDGFAKLGLSCADCQMGPCRINPFSRNEESTVCGFDKDDLVYRNMMHILGAAPIYTRDYMASILSAVSDICAVNLNSSVGQTKIGYGVLDEKKINICVENVPFPRLAELEAAAASNAAIYEAVGAAGFKFTIIGSVCSKRETVCGYAEAEFAVMSGLVDAYVLGQSAVALGKNAAKHYHTAVISATEDAEKLLYAAAKAYANRDKAKICYDECVVAQPMNSMQSLAEIAGKYKKIAVFGGGSNIKQTAGATTVEAIRHLTDIGVACFLFGNAIIVAAKAGLTEHVYACGGTVSDVLNYDEIREKAAVVCMPELAIGEQVAQSIFMGERGLKVITATELPIQGAQWLAEEINARVLYVKPEEFAAKAVQLIG